VVRYSKENKVLKVNTFYELFNELCLKFPPTELSALHSLKPRLSKEFGVYIFLDPVIPSKYGMLGRIVRIGSHELDEKKGEASKAITIYDRLKCHFGAQSGGGTCGNSVFRRHVKNCFISIAEHTKDINFSVSKYVRPLMFTYVSIPLKCYGDRKKIEENLIGLLSHADGYGIDPITTEWLGYNSINEFVVKAQLFNDKHTRPSMALPEDAFFDMLEHYINKM
jgi:hypothetical protein